jgi:hypothetical protein
MLLKKAEGNSKNQMGTNGVVNQIARNTLFLSFRYQKKSIDLQYQMFHVVDMTD